MYVVYQKYSVSDYQYLVSYMRFVSDNSLIIEVYKILK